MKPLKLLQLAAVLTMQGSARRSADCDGPEPRVSGICRTREFRDSLQKVLKVTRCHLRGLALERQ